MCLWVPYALLLLSAGFRLLCLRESRTIMVDKGTDMVLRRVWWTSWFPKCHERSRTGSKSLCPDSRVVAIVRHNLINPSPDLSDTPILWHDVSWLDQKFTWLYLTWSDLELTWLDMSCLYWSDQTGSYPYMTWRDLDIDLILTRPDRSWRVLAVALVSHWPNLTWTHLTWPCPELTWLDLIWPCLDLDLTWAAIT